MKNLIVLGFAMMVATAAVAGDCGNCSAAKKDCKDKAVSACPVSRAKHQAKASAGSIKEHAKASKAALKIGTY